jgi:hypothetical protein
MKTNIHIITYIAQFFLEWEMFQNTVVQKTRTHILPSIIIFRKSCRFEIMQKYAPEAGRPQTKIRRMCIASWIPKLTNTHSEYMIFIDFPLQQCLHERVSMLRLYENCLSCLINFLQNYDRYHDGRLKHVCCIWCGSIMHEPFNKISVSYWLQ